MSTAQASLSLAPRETVVLPVFGKERFAMTELVDRFGRRFPYLRLSLIDACNFRCSYCLPNGYRAREGRPEPLNLAEIRRLLRAFRTLGMRKLRLTGGEPSLRRDLTEVIACAADLQIEKIALTTNGTVLNKRVAQWRAAGLTHLNVSVDSLDPDCFARVTGNANLADILAGVEQALALRFHAVKLNAVLLREVNDQQWPQWLDYLRDRRLTVRFIELMQTGDNAEYFARHHLRADVMQAWLLENGWRELPRAADAGPAREFIHEHYQGRFGFIAPYARNFCADCNRLRVTSMGDLRLCLFGDSGMPLRDLLSSDSAHEALVERLQKQLGIKAAAHQLHEGLTGLTTNLSTIGG